MRALTHIKSRFPVLLLHNRVLIVVPDANFLCALTPHLQELLANNPDTCGLELTCAAHASANVDHKQDLKETLVIDAVDEIDGLERVFAICVGLDAAYTSANKV